MTNSFYVTFKGNEELLKGIDSSLQPLIQEYIDSSFMLRSVSDIRPALKLLYQNFDVGDCSQVTDDDFINIIRTLSKIDNKIGKNNAANRIISFFKFIITEKTNKFNVINKYNCKYKQLVKFILLGYEPIYLDDYVNNVPSNDLLLLTTKKATTFLFISVDFSCVSNSILRQGLKRYFLSSEGSNVKSKLADLANFAILLNSLDFTDDVIEVTSRNLMDYKNILSRKYKINSEQKISTCTHNMLEFLNEEKFLNYSNENRKYLQTNGVQKKGNMDRYSEDEVLAIRKSCKLIRTKNTEFIDTICSLIIELIFTTPLRLTNLLELRINSIQCDELSNNWKIITNTKMRDDDVIPITLETKKLLDDVMQMTKEIRKNAPVDTEYESLLFVRYLQHGKGVGKVFYDTVSNFLKRICALNNIEFKNVSAIRNNYMKAVTELATRSQRPLEVIPQISGHGVSAHLNFYHTYEQDEFERNIFELFKVEIGSVDMDVQVLKKYESSLNHEVVLNGGGFCSVKECKENEYFSCLLCKNFVITLENKSFFRAEIDRIDNEILRAEFIHDVEHLRSKKKLVVACYAKLLEMERGNMYVTN